MCDLERVKPQPPPSLLLGLEPVQSCLVVARVMSNYGYKKKRSVPVIFEPPCTLIQSPSQKNKIQLVERSAAWVDPAVSKTAAQAIFQHAHRKDVITCACAVSTIHGGQWGAQWQDSVQQTPTQLTHMLQSWHSTYQATDALLGRGHTIVTSHEMCATEMWQACWHVRSREITWRD